MNRWTYLVKWINIPARSSEVLLELVDLDEPIRAAQLHHLLDAVVRQNPDEDLEPFDVQIVDLALVGPPQVQDVCSCEPRRPAPAAEDHAQQEDDW